MESPQTSRSLYHWPMSGLGLGVGLFFVAVGIGIRFMADASKIPNLWLLIFDPETPGSGKDGSLYYIGWAFILLGGLAAVAFAWKRFRPAWVGHAPDELLPELSRQAVIGKGARMMSVLTHELVGDRARGAVQPAPDPMRRRKLFIVGFALLFMALFCQLVLVHAPDMGGKGGLALRVVFCVAGCFAAAIVCGVIYYSVNKGTKDLPWCRWEGDVVSLGRGEEQGQEVGRDQLRALQLCAAKVRSTGEGGSTQMTSGLELSLCWEQDGELYRDPILLNGGELWRLLRLAEAWAATLDLPLLFHATHQDYRKAKQRRIETSM